MSDNHLHLVDFSLRLVYPFAFDPRTVEENGLQPLLALRLPEVTLPLPIAETLREKLACKAEEGKDLSVWCVDSERPISSDFYPHIRHLLQPNAGDRSHGLQLTTAAWQVLEGGYGDFGDGLELQLSKLAVNRLSISEAERWVSFSTRRGFSTLAPPRIVMAGSGFGALELVISPDADFLRRHGAVGAQEFLYAAARLGKAASLIRWKGTGTGGDATCTLERILSALVPDTLVNVEPLAFDRMFSFAALRMEHPLGAQDAQALAHRIAHRQTDHYQPTREAINTGTYAPFENIVYAMSTEGGALILGGSEESEQILPFFSGFISNQVRQVYWPLVLLAYLEYLKLVRLTGDVCRDLDFHQPRAQDHRELEKFRADILDFRLNYRFSQASHITQHNQYYQAWREAFGCDHLLQELNTDVDAVNDFLSYKLDERSNRLQERGNRMLNAIGIYGFPAVFWAGFFQFVLQDLPPLSELLQKGGHVYLSQAVDKVHWPGVGLYLILTSLSMVLLRLLTKRAGSRGEA